MKKRTLTAIFLPVVFFLSIKLSFPWTITKRLTYNSGASETPVLCSDILKKLHVLYKDDTPGKNEIFYKQSPNQGFSWVNQRLTWNSHDSMSPVMKVNYRVILSPSGGIQIGIFIVWTEYFSGLPGNYEVFFKRSLDSGTTWSPTKRITWNSGESIASGIVLGISDRVHIVWSDSTHGNSEIFYKKSTDNGTDWGTTNRITWNSGTSMNAKVAMDSASNLHMVWDDNSPGNWEIYYKNSTDGGNNWSESKRLTWNSGSSQFCQIVVDTNDDLHVVWHDDTPGNYEIFYKKSTDGGMTWSSIKRLVWNTGRSMSPVIVTDKLEAIHIVWEDNAPGNWEIFYKKSTDSGTTWSAPQRLTWTSADSLSPSISSDNENKVHIVWSDLMSGNWEIYYKRSD